MIPFQPSHRISVQLQTEKPHVLTTTRAILIGQLDIQVTWETSVARNAYDEKETDVIELDTWRCSRTGIVSKHRNRFFQYLQQRPDLSVHPHAESFGEPVQS